jgi:hypothetical protein
MGCHLTWIVTERNGYLHSVELLRHLDNCLPPLRARAKLCD